MVSTAIDKWIEKSSILIPFPFLERNSPHKDPSPADNSSVSEPFHCTSSINERQFTGDMNCRVNENYMCISMQSIERCPNNEIESTASKCSVELTLFCGHTCLTIQKVQTYNPKIMR